MKFKVGDIVRLKSGGPNMTIQEIGQSLGLNRRWEAECVWFAGRKHQSATFDLDVIELAPSESEEGTPKSTGKGTGKK